MKGLGYLDIQIDRDTKRIERKEKNMEKESSLIVVEGKYTVTS